MKRLYILIISLVLPYMVVAAQNTAAPSVSDIFSGKVVPRREMKRTSVQGDRLAGLRLSEFVSVQFQADDNRLKLISSIIDNSARTATAKETETDGSYLTYAFITLQPTDEGLNQYLGYSAKPQGEEYWITVIYFCGATSASELKDKLSK